MSNKEKFHNNIIDWYLSSGRKFPWRENNCPYNILISEILLQRTKAEQVKPVYLKLIKTYPNIEYLSEANLRKIEEIITPLGLIKRAQYLSEIARFIQSNHNGKIPDDKKELLKIKGIGDYTANSLLVFGYNKKNAIVDSNVIRILNRVFKLDYNNRKPNKFIKNIAKKLLPNEKIKQYSYGLLDIGSLICTPRKKPNCNECPLKIICLYNNSN